MRKRVKATLVWDTQRQRDINDGQYIREQSSPLYHTARWTRLSRAWRASHPLCAECLRHGIYKSAEVVDHIIPFPICQDFFDVKNLQSLCMECNNIKGIQDRPKIQEYKKAHYGK